MDIKTASELITEKIETNLKDKARSKLWKDVNAISIFKNYKSARINKEKLIERIKKTISNNSAEYITAVSLENVIKDEFTNQLLSAYTIREAVEFIDKINKVEQ